MAALPYIQLYVADYLADTAHLTAAQHGAYLLLIMNYWQRGKPLNNFNERLTNVARMSNDEWETNKKVLQEFFIIDGDEWTHSRIEADLAAVLSKSTKASAAGKASAQRKLNERSTNVDRTFNHTDTDTDTDTDKTYTAASAVKKSPPKINPALKLLLDHGITPQTANDFLAIRKAKRAPLTETALDGIRHEAERSQFTLEEALIICCKRGWQGFDSDWLIKPKTEFISRQDRLRSVADQLTGRSNVIALG